MLNEFGQDETPRHTAHEIYILHKYLTIFIAYKLVNLRFGILLRKRAGLLTSWLRERYFERDAQRVCWNLKSIWWISWPRRNAASYQPQNLNSSQVLDNFYCILTQWAAQFIDASHAWFHGTFTADKCELMLFEYLCKTRSKRFLGSCVLKASAVKHRLIPPIYNLHHHLCWYLVSNWLMIDNQSRMDLVSQTLHLDWHIWVGQQLLNQCRLSVN